MIDFLLTSDLTGRRDLRSVPVILQTRRQKTYTTPLSYQSQPKATSHTDSIQTIERFQQGDRAGRGSVLYGCSNPAVLSESWLFSTQEKSITPLSLTHTQLAQRDGVCERESQLNSSRVSSNSSCARNPENLTDNKLRQQQLVSVYSSMQMLF